MMKEIPKDVISLVSLIKEKYPTYDLGDDYFPLIKYLYHEMCDEYLVVTLSFFTSKPLHEIENDIYCTASMNIDISKITLNLNIDFENL